MKKKILVTGGTGFIGSNIVNKLLSLGHEVVVIDNNQRGRTTRLLKHKNLKFIQGDIRSYNDLFLASKKINTIIHCAYVNGTKTFYKKPDLILDIAVTGIQNILNLVKNKKIKEFYLISSSEVYQLPEKIPTPEEVPLTIPDILNPRFSYGGGKIISEMISIHAIKKFVKKLIIVRPHNVYGPDMGQGHVIPEIIQKIIKASNNFKKKIIKLEIQGSGNETRAFTYIDDFVDGLMILMNIKTKFAIYHIGNDEETKVIKVVKKILSILKLEAIIKKKTLLIGSVLRRCPNIYKMKKIGFRNKISLTSGLKLCINWHLKNLN